MGENPVLSDPDALKVRKTLAGLDFLAVSDLFLTETAGFADVVFPAASFAEKIGTVTNSERRVQLMHQAIEPIGSCRTDAEIIVEISRHMSYEMDYENTAEIMEDIALVTPIYGGIYHDRLENQWGLQWPCTDRAHPGTIYLHKYSFTRGRGYFALVEDRCPAESPDEDYPFLLMTGRIYHHYHTGTMTRRCEMLERESPDPFIDMHPDDARSLQVRTGDLVRISSRRGAVEMKARVVDQVGMKTLYAPFHFHEAPINKVTTSSMDPEAKIPEYKICAVRVEKVMA